MTRKPPFLTCLLCLFIGLLLGATRPAYANALESMIRHAEHALQRDDPETARRAMLVAARVAPDASIPKYLLAQAEFALRHYAAALDAAAAYLQHLDSKSRLHLGVHAMSIAAASAFALGAHDIAAGYYLSALHYTREPPLALYRTTIAVMQDSPAHLPTDIFAIIDRAVARFPEANDLVRLGIDLAQADGDWDNALRRADQAIRQQPDTLLWRKMKADALVRMGDTVAARQLYETTLERGRREPRPDAQLLSALSAALDALR